MFSQNTIIKNFDLAKFRFTPNLSHNDFLKKDDLKQDKNLYFDLIF